MHVIAQVAHFLTFHPFVQAFVKNIAGAVVGANALEYLIKKWLIPKYLIGQEKIEKEASMIHLFHQEFGKIVSFFIEYF